MCFLKFQHIYDYLENKAKQTNKNLRKTPIRQEDLVSAKVYALENRADSQPYWMVLYFNINSNLHNMSVVE